MGSGIELRLWETSQGFSTRRELVGVKCGVKQRSQRGSCLNPTPDHLPSAGAPGNRGTGETLMWRLMGRINAQLLWVCLLCVANWAVSVKSTCVKIKLRFKAYSNVCFVSLLICKRLRVPKCTDLMRPYKVLFWRLYFLHISDQNHSTLYWITAEGEYVFYYLLACIVIK